MNAIRESWMPARDVPAGLALPLQELLSRLLGEAREKPVKQLMMVGAARGVGTSFIARHWAAQLAPAFGSVLLIEVTPDGDDPFSAAESPAALLAKGPVATLRMPQQACLDLSGRGGASLPAEWLDAFGLVVWDVPPVTTAPVAMVLAHAVDRIVLLTQANRTRRQVASHAAQRLQESGGRLLGVVMNRTLNFIPSWIYRLL